MILSLRRDVDTGALRWEFNGEPITASEWHDKDYAIRWSRPVSGPVKPVNKRGLTRYIPKR